MASVASSFSYQNGNTSEHKTGAPGLPGFPGSFQNTGTTASETARSDSVFSSLSSQPTSATTASGTPSLSPPLKPQMTGFSGLKPFKPTSSFGASLLESLPPLAGSNTNTTTPGGSTSTPSSAPGGLLFLQYWVSVQFTTNRFGSAELPAYQCTVVCWIRDGAKLGCWPSTSNDGGSGKSF